MFPEYNEYILIGSQGHHTTLAYYEVVKIIRL